MRLPPALRSANSCRGARRRASTASEPDLADDRLDAAELVELRGTGSSLPVARHQTGQRTAPVRAFETLARRSALEQAGQVAGDECVARADGVDDRDSDGRLGDLLAVDGRHRPGRATLDDRLARA